MGKQWIKGGTGDTEDGGGKVDERKCIYVDGGNILVWEVDSVAVVWM